MHAFTSHQHHQARELAALIEDEPDTECPECGGPAHYVADFDGDRSYARPVCDGACRPCSCGAKGPTDHNRECVRCAAEAAAEDARLAMAVAS